MDPSLFLKSAFLVLVFIIFLVFVKVPVSLCSYDRYCSKQFNCRNITGVGYPFWGDDRPSGCGIQDLKLSCVKNITTIKIMKMNYLVLGVDHSTKILKIVREDYLGGICSQHLVNTTLNSELFDYGPGYGNITLFYGCPSTNIAPLFSYTIDGIANKGGYIEDGAHGPGPCAKCVVVPVLATRYKDIGN